MNFKKESVSKFIYKVTAWLVSMVILVFAIAVPAYAITGGSGLFQSPVAGSLPDLIAKLLIVVVNIGFPLLAVAIVYSGFLFVTARGNEQTITKAKAAFFYSVIGGAVLLGAKVLAETIRDTITS